MPYPHPNPTGGLIPGLTLVTQSTGMEAYRYIDPEDGGYIEVWICNDDSLLFDGREVSGEPRVPANVIRWLAARAQYLTETGGPPWQS